MRTFDDVNFIVKHFLGDTETFIKINIRRDGELYIHGICSRGMLSDQLDSFDSLGFELVSLEYTPYENLGNGDGKVVFIPPKTNQDTFLFEKCLKFTLYGDGETVDVVILKQEWLENK